MLKVAAAQYSLKKHNSFGDFKINAEEWVSAAAAKKARLLVFPEYGSIELVSLMNSDVQKDLQLQLKEIQKYRDDFLKCYIELAKKYNVFIITPSFPWSESVFTNRAFFISPDGTVEFQDKQVMTRFEDEEWMVSSPSKKELKLFNVDGIQIGISICFDIEFPDFSRELALNGAQIIVAPSCTETAAGMNRVHVGARARALENQLYVIVAQTVGSVDYSEAIDFNTGRAAIYSTCDRGFPDDGILAAGSVNVPEWITYDLDLKKIKDVRENGAVFNFSKIKTLG